MSAPRNTSTGVGQPPLRRRVIATVAAVAVALWSAAVIAGIQRIWSYKDTPGEQSSAPAMWPGSSLVNVDDTRATLMMFVHPLCVCTRASLTELRETLDAMGGSTAVWIVLLNPQGIGPSWDEKRIANISAQIPEATLVTDVDGMEADRFGASTSGHVVLYDRQGALAFSGGITGARGHVGDNEGRRGLMTALMTAMGGDSAHSHEHPIFGCGLNDPDPIQR
jgi:hypothetical protein